MRALPLLIAIAGIAATAFAQPPAQEPLMHVSTSFDLVVHASYPVAAPLFGPAGERAWAGHDWNPKFVYPQPERDVEGAVFTVPHGAIHATWVNTLFDLESRHFQYVYFLPDLMVTVIDVRFNPLNETSTAVHVVYTRTALTLEGNHHVAAMNESDRSAGPEWQKAIDDYLAGSRESAHPQK